ncbi:MAG: DoxX family protein [Actinomycetia bacterium]|nr:DoxX family protein [Actinomycetes bacterium]
MSLMRFAARSMLASFFVVQGAKAVVNPEPLVAGAEPIARSFVPLAQRVAPASLAGYVPEETQTLVRATGAAQVVGGLMLATGIGRRLGAAVLGLSMVPHVLASRPSRAASAEQREIAKSQLLRNVALLGGAILASLDTQGKPSLAWLAADRRERLTTEARRTGRQLALGARRTGKGVAQDTRRAARTTAQEARQTQKALRRAGTRARQQVAQSSPALS